MVSELLILNSNPYVSFLALLPKALLTIVLPLSKPRFYLDHNNLQKSFLVVRRHLLESSLFYMSSDNYDPNF